MTVKELEAELKKVNSEKDKAVAQIEEVEKQLDSKTKAADELADLLKEQEETIKEYEKDVPELEKEIADLKAKLEEGIAGGDPKQSELDSLIKENSDALAGKREAAQKFTSKLSSLEKLMDQFQKDFKEISKG